MTEIRFGEGMSDYFRRVLEEREVTGQELARFARLEPLAQLAAVMYIEEGAPVGETIDRAAESQFRRRRK